MLYDIECLYYPLITLWIEMKEKLKRSILPHYHWNSSLDSSLNHANQPSVGHVFETEYHYSQPMYDPEFITRTIH